MASGLKVRETVESATGMCVRDGFSEGRRALYNLYPLPVHARLFGPSWARAVAASADRILRGNLI